MMVLVSTTDIADPSVRGAPFEHGLVPINSECVGFRAVTLDSSLFTRAANRVPILPGSRGILLEEHPRGVWRRVLFPDTGILVWIHTDSVRVL